MYLNSSFQFLNNIICSHIFSFTHIFRKYKQYYLDNIIKRALRRDFAWDILILGHKLYKAYYDD